MTTHVQSYQLTNEAATDTISLTGFGFQPTGVFLMWGSPESASAEGSHSSSSYFGFGFASGTSERYCWAVFEEDGASTTNTSGQMRDDCLMCGHTSGQGRLDLQSFDADGLTLIMDEVMNAAYDTVQIHVLAFDYPCEAGDFQLNNSTGNQTVSGLAVDPSAVFFIGQDAADTAFPTAGASDFMLGFMDGTSEYVLGYNAQSGASNQRTRSYFHNAECIAFVDNSSVVGRASHVSLGSGQFVINVDEVSGATSAIAYFAIEGDFHAFDSAMATDTTPFSPVTGLAFDPEGGLFIGSGISTAFQASDTVRYNEQHLSIGIMAGTSERAAISWATEHGADPTQTGGAYSTISILDVGETSGTPAATLDIDSLDSGGITVVQDDAAASAWVFCGIVFAGAADTGLLQSRGTMRGVGKGVMRGVG